MSSISPANNTDLQEFRLQYVMSKHPTEKTITEYKTQSGYKF